MSKYIKSRIYNTFIRPIMMYSTKDHIKTIHILPVAELKIVRKQEQTEKKTDIREQYELQDIVKVDNVRSSYVRQMDENKAMVKKTESTL